jgi:mannose-6-phosphate isomerase-like protein (cupin superfamily)
MGNEIQIQNAPWGKLEILNKFEVKPEGNVCVSIITINAKQSLPYQSHKLRGEHWTFVQGRGTVILDDVSTTVVAGSGINVPVETKHRVINMSDNQDLIFIEVSTGHFDENDIERFEDDFGRVK